MNSALVADDTHKVVLSIGLNDPRIRRSLAGDLEGGVVVLIRHCVLCVCDMEGYLEQRKRGKWLCAVVYSFKKS